MHSQSPMGQLSQRVVQSQNSLLFSDDEDEEDWILAACSDQVVDYVYQFHYANFH